MKKDNLHDILSLTINEEEIFMPAKDNTYANCLAVLSSSDIIETDKSMMLNLNKQEIELYEYNKEAYKILKEVYKKKEVIGVKILYTSSIILNMMDYNSVKETYELLKLSHHIPKNDKELILFSKKYAIPQKQLLIMQISLGGLAFPNSKVSKYKVRKIICMNTKLIQSVYRITENTFKV